MSVDFDYLKSNESQSNDVVYVPWEETLAYLYRDDPETARARTALYDVVLLSKSALSPSAVACRETHLCLCSLSNG